MKKSFTEEQIVGILSEANAGTTAIEVYRRHGISEGTSYRWKAKYGGMPASDVKPGAGERKVTVRDVFLS